MSLLKAGLTQIRGSSARRGSVIVKDMSVATRAVAQHLQAPPLALLGARELQ